MTTDSKKFNDLLQKASDRTILEFLIIIKMAELKETIYFETSLRLFEAMIEKENDKTRKS